MFKCGVKELVTSTVEGRVCHGKKIKCLLLVNFASFPPPPYLYEQTYFQISRSKRSTKLLGKLFYANKCCKFDQQLCGIFLVIE